MKVSAIILFKPFCLICFPVIVFIFCWAGNPAAFFGGIVSPNIFIHFFLSRLAQVVAEQHNTKPDEPHDLSQAKDACQIVQRREDCDDANWAGSLG